jgi:hypothetical protein
MLCKSGCAAGGFCTIITVHGYRGNRMSFSLKALVPQLFLAVLGLLLFVRSSHAFDAAMSSNDTHCYSRASCNKLGRDAYQRGDYLRAAEFFANQVDMTEELRQQCSGSSASVRTGDLRSLCKGDFPPPEPYNNAALAWLKAGEPLKAKMWLTIAPGSSITNYNKRLVDQALRNFRWPSSPEGDYWSYAGYGVWNEVTVAKDGLGYAITFDGIWFPSNYSSDGVPNVGHFDGLANITSDSTLVRDGDGCTIEAHFKADQVELKELGGCMFGENVQATGVYMRVSTHPSAEDAQ